MGIDYEYNRKFGVYRQAMYQTVRRARLLGYEHVSLGLSSDEENPIARVRARQLGTVVRRREKEGRGGSDGKGGLPSNPGHVCHGCNGGDGRGYSVISCQDPDTPLNSTPW
ncbi:hypothetical protein OQ856_12470 [Mycobacterium ulcerans]|nr:hypothetical protein [Mycobacterium ulcerans]